ncbi:hypothetical protein ACQPZG_31935 [Streptomyces sp. CA-294286]|uniref:hypothetical protein n=1 Tax=Streptomyces sp. CA-294286 TaxID=3240070 RepID=UPI003D94FF82
MVLPDDLRVPPADELAGSMMRYWAPLSVDGTVVTCSECGVYRDWLVLNREDHVWVHCRSGHETYVPGLDGAWFAENSGPITGLFQNRDEGLKSYGYDGFLKGTIL